MINNKAALDILFDKYNACMKSKNIHINLMNWYLRALKVAAEECYREEVEQPTTVDMIIAEEEVPYKDEWVEEKIEGWLKQTKEI